jgi:hypothetical protein
MRRVHAIPICFFILLCGIAAPTTATRAATTYYVGWTNNSVCGNCDNSYDGQYANTNLGGIHGPWLNFAPCNPGGLHQLTNGCMLYVVANVIVENPGPGFTFTYEQYNDVPRFTNVIGTSNLPVTIAPSSNGVVIFTNCGPDDGFSFTSCEWLKVYGFQFTNNYRTPLIKYCTNCEFYSNYSGADLSYPNGSLGTGALVNNSQSNYIHNNAFGPSVPENNECSDGGTHGFEMGTYNVTNDFTAFNIIESNIFYMSGHDVLDCYGPSNIIQNNWCWSPPWYAFPSCYPSTNLVGFVLPMTAYWGSRLMEIGFEGGNGNVVQSNDCDYCGWVPDNPGAITLSDAVWEIVRFNRIACAAGQSIQIYGGKAPQPLGCRSNYIYNNSMAFGGYNTTFFTNGVLTNVSYPTWQDGPMGFVHTSSNFVVNNLGFFNFSDSSLFDDYATNIARWENNVTNVNPLWVSTNNTMSDLGVFPEQTPPDFHLSSGSPALDAGTWLAFIESVGEGGNSITVDNSGYFSAGLTACSRYIPGDTIEFEGTVAQTGGGPLTAVINAIDGNTITFAASVLTLTNGQGIAIHFSGDAPNVGAY